MIQANELRIGNLLRLNNPEARPKETGKIVKVVAVDSVREHKQKKGAATVYLLDDDWEGNFGQWIDFLEPILIDESWLRRAGFDNGWIISHNREEFNMFYTGGVYFYSADYLHHNSVGIKYVHQLQNLFFALTGTELEFSDK